MEEHAYDASRAAAAERDRLLGLRSSFITENVFSHESKVELVATAERLGYQVDLSVMLLPLIVTAARVDERVSAGGLSVPPGKVSDRYERLWTYVAAAAVIASYATFYDNSQAAHPFREVGTFVRGRALVGPDWPEWTPEPLLAL